MKKTIAIIDLGSNSIRMNIIGINEYGGYSIFDQASEMVRLSEGMGTALILREEPMRRTIEALKYFKQLIKLNDTKEVYALATAAVRMAKNKEAFLSLVKEEVGLEFKVLTGKEEAYYDYLGVVNSMELKTALLLDIGGGSTEIIYMVDRVLKESISLPFGSVTLTEKFADQKSKKKRIEASTKFIQDHYDKLKWLDQVKNIPIIGLGGVIRTIGKIDRDRNGYPIENMHNYKLHDSEIERLFDLILNTEEKDLDKISGISKKRADIITLGLLPFKCLFERVDAPEVRISGSGLRDGVFYEKYFPSVGMPIILEDVLIQSKQNMMRRFEVNEKHARQVQSLALGLYEGLKSLLNEGPSDIKVLSTAALLHDIGIHIEYYDHHVHGFYLILNGRLEGLTNTERISVAYLVGSHREAGIKAKMTDFEGLLSKSELNRLGQLVVIMNLAEHLDRAENGVVKTISVEIFKDEVVLHLEGEGTFELEKKSVMRFTERFEKQFSKRLTVI
ncbi:MAG: hypothetical protein BGO41_13215 [Clostridiales bacterium 38-18]|nr:MAG: hypothetical protein BGO41_13215 [Clostridiales bacterium 38-18]